MSFTVREPKLVVLLHRRVRSAIRDIKHMTLTAITCPPIDSWSQLTEIVRAMRDAVDELEWAVELRQAENRTADREKLAKISERENDASDRE
jgi:hypothetical protein